MNKKIYQLSDLPEDYQAKVNQIIDITKRQKITEQLQDKIGNAERGMIFFKWYGQNSDTTLSVDDYHKPFNYIRTIGISIFNNKVSTAKHFGPFRPTLRVLYNINDIASTQSYSEVGETINRWTENKLFIFDDTLIHHSVNQTDEVRYCLFVDILRPS
ncbi:MAG: aspartyl/asparaginyl beta-hydroxylase domain-containing protein [Gammaproteobacteria bacterium]|nr:aspartyl/asparaginyl beta-hydroxylase domain-containing protein [Gammaproteobacteria bacterium]